MDRNILFPELRGIVLSSLSARRAWIEIPELHRRFLDRLVALRKESVDRNYAANAVDQILPGRSPQGERG